MARTQGARNVVSFVDRESIATTDSAQIRHLARQTDQRPLEQFNAQLGHQSNFLNWVDTRHFQLQEAKAELNPNGRGPKDSVYRKYRWYAEQTTLLEAINCFEVFYKSTFIALATAIRRYVDPHSIKGTIDAKVLWTSRGRTSLTALIFEHQLYHDLEQIDKVTSMLIGAKRYHPNDMQSPMRARVLALQAVFQVRHTLSHNQGRVTQSDRAKFASLGYDAKHGEILDPIRDHLGRVIRELLEKEAADFTNWILERCAVYLKGRNEVGGIQLPQKLRERIEKDVGTHTAMDDVAWA